MSEEFNITALKDSMRDMLTQECPIEVVQRRCDGDVSLTNHLWSTMAELGWLAIAVPEELGGLGLGDEGLLALYEEAGRAVAPVPLMANLMSMDALTRLGSNGRFDDLLGAVIAGKKQLAMGDLTNDIQLQGDIGSDSINLNGTFYVPDGGLADIFLAKVVVNDSYRLALIDRDLESVTINPKPVTDLTKTPAVVTLKHCVLGNDQILPLDKATQDALLRHAALAVAADALGGGEAILERTIEYLNVREQFGRVIGSFQALKHRVADHKTALVGVEALVSELGINDETLAGALEAKALAAQTYLAVAQDCVQLHGGIGFTWEYPAHIYLKRALSDTMTFGTIESTLDRFFMELSA